jgi:hypothetical protein
MMDPLAYDNQNLVDDEARQGGGNNKKGKKFNRGLAAREALKNVNFTAQPG